MSKQFGLVTRAQALGAGLSERQIDHRLQSGVWRVVHPRVYAANEYPADWHHRALAACLWAGFPATLSHRIAALLWKLEGIVGSRVEITTPRRLTDSSVLIHRSNLLSRVAVTRIGGFPVTSLGRTLLDLAAVVPPERFEIALDSALRRGLTSTERLASEIGAQARGRPGAATLRRAVESYQHPPIESPLERGSSISCAPRAYPNPHRNMRFTPTASLSPGSIRLSGIAPRHRGRRLQMAFRAAALGPGPGSSE